MSAHCIPSVDIRKKNVCQSASAIVSMLSHNTHRYVLPAENKGSLFFALSGLLEHFK